MKLTAADDLVVSLDYTVRLSGGEVVAASTPGDRKALEFLQGRGQILPTLEHALYGMATGQVRAGAQDRSVGVIVANQNDVIQGEGGLAAAAAILPDQAGDIRIGRV